MANPQDSSVARSNDTNADIGTSTQPNIMTMTTQQAQGQGIPNGYGRYQYESYGNESGHPNFAPVFSNNPMQYADAASRRQSAPTQYAYAARPRQSAPMQNAYAAPPQQSAHMQYPHSAPPRQAAPMQNPYAAPPGQAAAMQNAYAATPRDAAPPGQAEVINMDMNMNGYATVNTNTKMNEYNGYYQLQYQPNQPLTQQLQPAGRFDSRPNGLVGAGWMQRRRPAASTAADISEEIICIGPRYMRIRDPETLSANGGEGTHDQYNHPGFITRYENAKFFLIKSRNKEDVLNSIIHGVWTSTLSGNYALNATYKKIQREQTIQGIGSGTSTASPNCPIFLLFSIRGSRNLCGVAEMVGPIDFEAKTEFWPWKGKFPVKWHIIKDVPFKEVRHITVEGKVTDWKQLDREKGQAMLDIFKNYVGMASLLNKFTLRRREDE